MRKLFVTLLTVSLLTGLFLAGAMPVMVMAAASAPAPALANMQDQMAASVGMDCEHHGSKAPATDHRPASHGDLSCCVSGHCPMLGQGLAPVGTVGQLFLMGSPVRPVVLSLHRGVVESPHLRPPRNFF
ncbi:MAG: hypothetical protein HYU58_21560 [Proteobacteria bacterium]|nr:hypothetical protein [Pseudomonadota bacterium]